MKTVFALVVVFLLMAAASANASVVFSQAPVDGAPSRISDWSDDRQKSDDFTLTGGARIVTKIRWWGSYGADVGPPGDPTPAEDSFTFHFFVEDPYNPGYPDIWRLGYGTPYERSFTAAGFSRTATSLFSTASGLHDGGGVYEYAAILDKPIHLEAGTRYWLTITNATPAYTIPTSSPNARWGWLESGNGSHWYRMGHCPLCADDWTAMGGLTPKNLAFALETFPQVTITNKAASAPIIADASARFLFKVWGKPKVTGANTFELDDGSGRPISVESPGYAGLTGVSHVAVTGLLSYSASGSVLKADPADIAR